MMLGRSRRVHFVGVGGIGMSGIAELLVNLGHAVSGSDAKRSELTDRLANMGARIEVGHDVRHVGDADIVVVSSAIRPDNPEVMEARRRGVPVIPRAEMLAELMRLRYGIAVAGAHGKTTTTSMIALVLERAGLDPTAVIGGRLSAFGSNARLGHGAHMVAEADESDGSFLKLSPTIAVITNIDYEHLETYGSFEKLQDAFLDFANKVPFYGMVVACADDPPLRSLLPRMTRPVVTYGLDAKDSVLTAGDVQLAPFAATAVVRRRGDLLGPLRLHVPGRHNIANALAAIGVALELDVRFDRIAGALEEFRGADRRFQTLGEERGILVIDDYGHHPTEMAAVIAAARGLGRRIVVAFQPHRYTRTQRLLDRFGPALEGADEIVLTDIYAAGEDPIPGVTVESLADAIRRATKAPLHLVKPIDDVAPAVAARARRGDVVITLGAGSIGTVGARVLEELRRP